MYNTYSTVLIHTYCTYVCQLSVCTVCTYIWYSTCHMRVDYISSDTRRIVVPGVTGAALPGGKARRSENGQQVGQVPLPMEMKRQVNTERNERMASSGQSYPNAHRSQMVTLGPKISGDDRLRIRHQVIIKPDHHANRYVTTRVLADITNDDRSAVVMVHRLTTPWANRSGYDCLGNLALMMMTFGIDIVVDGCPDERRTSRTGAFCN